MSTFHSRWSQPPEFFFSLRVQTSWHLSRPIREQQWLSLGYGNDGCLGGGFSDSLAKCYKDIKLLWFLFSLTSRGWLNLSHSLHYFCRVWLEGTLLSNHSICVAYTYSATCLLASAFRVSPIIFLTSRIFQAGEGKWQRLKCALNSFLSVHLPGRSDGQTRSSWVPLPFIFYFFLTSYQFLVFGFAFVPFITLTQPPPFHSLLWLALWQVHLWCLENKK